MRDGSWTLNPGLLWFGICLKEVGDAGDQVATCLPPNAGLLCAWHGPTLLFAPAEPSRVLESEVLIRRCISKQEFPREWASEERKKGWREEGRKEGRREGKKERRKERREGGRRKGGREEDRNERNFYQILPLCQVPYILSTKRSMD